MTARRFAGYVLDVDPTSPAHVHSHLVAEPAVVVGYDGNLLHQVAALAAPAVEYFELLSYQAATAVVRVGTNQRWQAGVKFHPLVGEPLPDQARRGDYRAGRGVFDHDEVPGLAGGMILTHQVARTGGYPPVGLSLLERAA